MSEHKRIGLALGLALLLAGCGQTGKLYLPEPAGEVVTRPTQTPEGATATPPAPATAPAPAPEDPDKEKKSDKKN
jgi:hypothetical protein